MRDKGSAAELQRRRVLAVERVLDGFSAAEVAEFLGINSGTVRRWVEAYRRQGPGGLQARPAAGRPPKLTRTQEKIALRWLQDSPTEHGFDTELWTAARLASLIVEEFGIELNRRYVCRWLAARGFSPQRPKRVPRERKPEVIAAWLQTEWPRLKKKRHGIARTSFSLTKAGF